MKRIISIFVLLASCLSFVNAQNTALTHPICNGDGEITVTIPAVAGYSPPFTVNYRYKDVLGQYQNITHTTNSYTDVLTNYIGGDGYLTLASGTQSFGYAYFNYNAFDVHYNVSNPFCNTPGTITVTHTPGSGTAPFSYQWFDQTASHTLVSTTNPTSLPIGSYTGIITDANGCKVYLNDSIYLWQQSLFITGTTTNAQCLTPGSITNVIVPQGVPPFTYQWSNSANTPDIYNLTAGAYSVTVTDNTGCSGYQYFYVYDNTAYNVNGVTNNASCNTGTISNLTMPSTATPFTYLWSNGATTSSLSNLVAGYYTVTVIDNLGCPGYGHFYVNQTPYITAQATVTPATCLVADGGATAFGTGGQDPYTYHWSNGSIAQSIDNVTNGYYTVSMVDANGCFGSQQVYISSSTPIYVNVTTTPSQCNAPTGSATLTISGGTAPYTTTWGTVPAVTGNSITNQAVGQYYFKIVDAVGCEYAAYADILPIRTLVFGATSTPATCIAANGSITTSISGGLAPYTYLWNNNATTSGISNLAVGYYDVQITDAGGCKKTTDANVYSTSPVSLHFSTTQASCIFTNNGALTAHAMGGTAPYIYSNSASGVQNNLAPSGYFVNVTDAHGCTASGYANVGYDVTNSSCYCTIKGNVFKDVNGNCVKDAGEVNLQNIAVYCSNYGYAYTDALGNYSFRVPAGTYTVSEVVQTMYPLAACQQATYLFTIASTTSGCTYTANFANKILPIRDLKINTWSNGTPPRPGFAYQQAIVISNQGTVDETNVYAGYRQPTSLPAAQFQSSALYQAALNWSKLSAPLDLTAGQEAGFYVDYMIPTTTPLGAVLTFKDTTARSNNVANWLLDKTPWDNVNYYQTATVGSFDPNFKEVSPFGTGTTHDITRADTVMDYAIHFQNLGTYFAQDVVIVDTLDSDFDIKTLKPIFGTHPYTVAMTSNGIVTFTFKDIRLPAKQNDEPGSKGMITYSIHVKKNLPNNTRLTNRAAIYFDFNAPVITNNTFNTIKNTVVGTDDTPNIPLADFKLYPNPTSSNITVEIPQNTDTEYTQARVTDIYGQTIITEILNSSYVTQPFTLNTADLPAGVYVVTLSTNNNTQQSKKFVKIN